MVRNAISFRAVTGADVPAMVQCHLNHAAVEPADSRIAAYLAGQHHPQQALPARTGYVAFVGEQVIGYIAGDRTNRHECEGEVQYLFVSPAYRLRGIGTALVQRLAQWFAQEGVRKVCIGVANDSPPPAKPFVESLGATPLNKNWYAWDAFGTLLMRDGPRL
jgi:GNAT superfamily N-acetyltransferase